MEVQTGTSKCKILNNLQHKNGENNVVVAILKQTNIQKQIANCFQACISLHIYAYKTQNITNEIDSNSDNKRLTLWNGTITDPDFYLVFILHTHNHARTPEVPYPASLSALAGYYMFL